MKKNILKIILLLQCSFSTQIKKKLTIKNKISDYLENISKKNIIITFTSIIALYLIYYYIKKINLPKSKKKTTKTIKIIYLTITILTN